jgi:hypothetical protein
MRWYHSTACALGVATLGLAACGGNGGSSPFSMPAKSSGPAVMTKVKATIVIPRAVKRGSSKKGRKYVSPSTEGLIVTVVDSTGTNSYGYDVQANAPGCSTNSSNETVCEFSITAAVGNDTFDAYTYDASEGTTNPTVLGSSFTAAGNLLSQETGYAATIAADTNNVVTLTLEAAVATVTASPAVLSVSGNGGTTNAADFEGIDGDSNQISLYPNASPFLNPISFSISDSGQHSTANTNETVTFDGSSSVQPQSATATPYSALYIGSDSLTNSGYGSNFSYPTSAPSVVIAPLFLYSSTQNTQSGSSVVLYALAAATPSAATYTITKEPDSSTNNCDVFTISTPAASPSPPQVAAYTITSTGASPQNTASPSAQIPCVFDVADGTGTITKSAAFESGSTSVIITVPTAAPTATPTSTPTASPTPTATPTASPVVTASPTATPTASPTASPTATLTASPTASPTATASPSPTASPTATPTASPTATPTPTSVPTPSPTPTTGGTVTFPVPSPAPSTTSTN